MTVTYAEITKQIAELERAAEDGRGNEIADAKARISASVARVCNSAAPTAKPIVAIRIATPPTRRSRIRSYPS